MKFYVDIGVADLPIIEYSTSAEEKFRQLPTPKGDLLLAVSKNFARGICVRDGQYFEDQKNNKGPGDICTLCFDDFTARGTLHNQPDWYHLLKNRIVATRAEEAYGPGQGITVTEMVAYGSATAKVRHQQAEWGRNGELVYVVKIEATGVNSLDDARVLHQRIISR